MTRYCPDKQNYVSDCEECTLHLCEMFFCLIVGSRTFNDYDFFCEKMNNLLRNKTDIVIVNGGAKGADSLAERYAEEHRHHLMVFKADWETYGNKAGYLRNRYMHEFISHYDRGCVAFWDGQSKGTKQNFDLAKKYGNPIKVIRVGQ